MKRDFDKEIKEIWFEAKEYGFGWGLPTCWQGWAVLAGYVGLTFLGMLAFPPHESLGVYFIYLTVLSVILGAICWLKGPRPRWRWGLDDVEKKSKRQEAKAQRRQERKS